MLIIFLALFLSSCSTLSPVDFKCSKASKKTEIDFTILEKCLLTDGVELEVHGAAPMSRLFVVTYRNPKNFFQAVHLSLLSKNPEVKALIPTLKRHDRIFIKGGFAPITSPQKHILAGEIKILSRSAQAPHSNEYTYQTLPGSILEKNHLIGKVHAVFGDGKILVVEEGDLVIPVFVEEPWVEAVNPLARGDKIEINYIVQNRPKNPVHLNFDPSAPFAFKVLHSAMQDHGRPITITGKLIRFPASPMVKFPVFAVNVDMGDGVLLPHTVLSFTDPELFAQARKLFQSIWDKHPQGVSQYRNKFINDDITVTVSGTYNMIHPLQANPQVVISNINEIKIEAQ